MVLLWPAGHVGLLFHDNKKNKTKTKYIHVQWKWIIYLKKSKKYITKKNIYFCANLLKYLFFNIISETFLNLLSRYGNHTFQHASFSPLIPTDHQDLSHFGFTNNNTISVFYPSFNNFVSILYLSFIIIIFLWFSFCHSYNYLYINQ